MEKGIEKRIYSGREMAEYCNMAYSTFYKYVKKGKLPKPIMNNARLGWDKKKVDEKLDELSPNTKFIQNKK